MEITIKKLFISMGFDITYDKGNMLFGYNDVKPLGIFLQINSVRPLDEKNIDSYIRIAQRDYTDIPLPVIFNMGGFARNSGNYKGIAYLMDVESIKQIITGNFLFNEILLDIISREGKPEKGTSLRKWAENRIKLYAENKLSVSEAVIFSDVGLLNLKATFTNVWKKNFFRYIHFIKLPEGSEELSDILKEWIKKQFDAAQKGTLSAKQQTLMIENGIIWPDNYPFTKKYNELFNFINKKKRLPFDYECKLYCFMVQELSGSGPNSLKIREIVEKFDFSTGCYKQLWLSELSNIVTEYRKVEKKIWKLSPGKISWLNRQLSNKGNKQTQTYKKKILSEKLGWTGEFYDIDWLAQFDAYTQLESKPQLKSEFWFWEIRQRKTELERYKKRLLDKIGFDFCGISNHWYDCYQRMKNLDSDLRQNVSYIGKDGIYWALVNRKSFCDGTLSNEKLQLLKEINFDFKEEEFEWFKKYEIVKQLYDTNCSEFTNEFKVGMDDWCSAQRKLIREVNLTMVRTDKLISAGFIASDPDFEKFIIMIKSIANKEKMVPQNLNDYPWIVSSPFRIAYALELGFNINPVTTELSVSDMAYFPLLLEFWKDETKRWEIYLDKIQNCANYLRISYKNKKLSRKILEQLNEVGFLWEEEDTEKWLYMLAKTNKFIELYNRVPGHKDKDCYVWRFKQLRLYKAGKLSEFRRNALESIRKYLPK